MLTVKITTHVRDALARFLNEYQRVNPAYFLPLNSDNTTIQVAGRQAIMAAFVNEIQNLENAIFSLNEGRQFFNGTTFPAVGAQLDGIGEIVGINRNGMGDAEYLIFIIATIAENFSQTTIPEVINVATLLFQKTSFLAFEMFPAEFNLEIPNDTPLDPTLFGLVAGIIGATLGAGIGLGFVAIYNAANPFQFTKVGGPSVGGGFGSTTGPGGGELGKLIYNDPGA